ncbi:hypothetical protein ACVWW7_004279 [Bradyrhizobium sp. LM6.9]
MSPKLPVGTNEVHHARRCADGNGGGEIVDHLGDDARPIDGIDAGQRGRIAEAMVVEHPLHERLAIVEIAFDSERVDIGRACRGHHPPLHLGNAAVRKQHDEIDILEPRERVDRSTAGVAGGRDHDGGALAALGKHMVHQPRDQLHRHILEGERRTMEQLQHELVRRHLAQRHHRRMAEGGVGLVRHATEFGIRYLAANKGADHLDCDLPIGTTEEAGDGLSRELRPDGRHIQAAVAGKPGQHHVAEAEFGGLAPGRDITSQTALQRPAEPELDPQAFDFTKLLVNSQRLGPP